MKIIICGCFTLFFACACVCGQQKMDSAWMQRYVARFAVDKVEKLKVIPLRDVDGNTVDISQYIGKTLYVNIWATGCINCIGAYQSEIKLIKKIRRMGLGDSIVFINICTGFGSDINRWKKLLSQRNDGSVNLYSSDSAIFTAWNTEILWPTFVLVDKAGNCLGKQVPWPEETMTAFMLLAATKNISAGDAIWNAFLNDILLMRGEDINDMLYFNYLKKYEPNYSPYFTWKSLQ